MIDALIREIRQICALGVANGCEAVDQLPIVIDAIDQEGAERLRAATTLPQVERHLGRAISLAKGTENEAIASALESCSDRFVWKNVTGDYGHEPRLEDFTDNFAYSVIMGPDSHSRSSLMACETIFLGLSIQAPDTYYPPHAHEAVEVYYVISGTAGWERAWLAPGNANAHCSVRRCT